MLSETLEGGRFSGVCLSEAFEKYGFSYQEKRFVNRLYMGTLEKLVFLDYCIDSFSKTPVKKMKPAIRNILRMSAYQIIFMDSVPSYAAISEALKLTGKRGFQGLKGFVSGVLRNLEREYNSLSFPDWVKASVPEWLYDMVLEQYGKEDCLKFFEAAEKKEEGINIRLNLAKGEPSEIIKNLEQEGCLVRPKEAFKGAYVLSGFENLTELKAFKEGLFIAQDAASMQAVEEAAKHADKGKVKNIIDLCASPGGKSLYMAEKFPDAIITARDKSEDKVKLIDENIKRLGIKNIRTGCFDATEKDPALNGTADIVIADLPCSGLGTIFHKPDILYRLKKEDLDSLSGLQRDILSAASEYLRKDGILAYSTCTINKKENEENMKWFSENYGFACISERTYLPGRDFCDGFYVAVATKK